MSDGVALTPRAAALAGSAARAAGLDRSVLLAALAEAGLTSLRALANSYEDPDELSEALQVAAASSLPTAAVATASEFLLDGASGATSELAAEAATVLREEPVPIPKIPDDGLEAIAPSGSASQLPASQPPDVDEFEVKAGKDDVEEEEEDVCRACDVMSMSMLDVFQTSRLVIPLFQRRYCWGPAQWTTLVTDASSGHGHSLGRLTAFQTDSGLVVCDGQQRCTSVLLLLAAIRDLAYTLPGGELLCGKIDGLLCRDKNCMEAWVEECGASGARGEDLSFLALSPTYLDRGAFFEALLPEPAASLWAARPEVAGASALHEEAKYHFVAEVKDRILAGGSLDASARVRLEDFANSVLSFRWVFFPLSIRDQQPRGSRATEDVYLIFQRLAWREVKVAEFLAAQRQGVILAASDLVRSLLLGSYSSEATSIAAYGNHWLQCERAGVAVAKRAGQSSKFGLHVDILLQCFLECQPEVGAEGDALADEGKVGRRRSQGGAKTPVGRSSLNGTDGLLVLAEGMEGFTSTSVTVDKYDKLMQRNGGVRLDERFRAWLQKVVVAEAAGACGESGSLADADFVERGADAALRRLSAFAAAYLDADEAVVAAVDNAVAAKQRDEDLVRKLRASLPGASGISY